MEKEPDQPDDPLDVPEPDAVKEEVNKQEVAKQEVAIAKEDVSIAKEDVAIPKEDVATAKEDVAIPKEDVAIAKEDVAIPKEDVAIAKEDVAIAKEDVSIPKQDVSTDAELIKDAQADLAKIDVLVCGACHEVYHFVEEFTEHKSSAEKCTGVPAVKCDNEEKHQVWGFTLWKNKQLKILKENGGDVPGSWEVYQKWVKTGQDEKDLWIAAGRTLQACHKIATAKVQESGGEGDNAKDKDPLALDANSDASEDSKKGLRTPIKSDKEEYIVENIAGKRFNPKKRQWEYKVKWENYDTETWEPLAHLENCKAMVEEYEAKIKTEKIEQKEKTPARGRGRPKVGQSPTPVKIIQKKTSAVTPIIFSSPGSRPQRTSKQKAVNQVKAWCGNISDSDEPFKRSFDSDSESSSSPFKKIKVGKKGSESEDYTDEETVVPVKNVATKAVVHTYNNGIGKKLPDNVLVPDSKGVVRISQKQLPSLSSGVYIMSRSSGIIKLDSTASKIATSGGQAIVKVGPKVGQTHIKVIKKPDGATRENVTAKPLKAIAQVASKTPTKKDVDKGKKIDVVQLTSTNFKEISRVPPKIFDDDSDDGVEELEFPKDLPLPVPESPPGEFVLDPITGKIAGAEYPDPMPLKTTNTPVKPVETLDNIVKLAAADITEEDLKPELNSLLIAAESPAVVSTTNQAPVVQAPVVRTPVVKTTVVQTPVQTPMSGGSSSTPMNKSAHIKASHSILNTAMVNSNILQKTLLTPISRKSQPRVLNQSVGARPQTHVVRSPIMKVGAARSKPNILPKKYNVAAATPPHMKTVYSRVKSGMPAKIGHTTIHYRTTTASAKSYPSASQARNQNATMTRIKGSPKVLNASVSHAAAATPKPIISMPSLTADDPPVAATLLTSSAVGVANSSSTSSDANLSSFTLADGDRPMFITGDDGTIYQVAGQNEDGQTILLTQDSDGQQQCLLVTNEAVQETTQQVESPAQVVMEVEEPPAEAAEEQPVVAQFIRTEPPSPGGTHKVVVMLPDGNIMVTQVTPEEYASLELEK